MAYVKTSPAAPDRVMLLRGRFGLGGSFTQRAFPVTADTVIKKGDVLKLVTVNNVDRVTQALAAADLEDVTVSAGNQVLVGIALEAISTNASYIETGTGKTHINVAILDANLEIGMRTMGVSASGDVNLTTVRAGSQVGGLTVGQIYRLARYTTAQNDAFYVLCTVATNGELVYVEPYASSAPTDVFGVAWTRLAINETIQQG